ncbi:MAG TPA: hypothetical protein VKY70_15255 [Pseudomonas sp.]|nr:hypothetical protein [Pseudomonas sp.]
MTRPAGHKRTRGAHAALLSSVWEGRPFGQTLLALVLTAGAVPLLMEAMTRLMDRPYTFYVTANTDVLTLTTTELSGTRWYLDRAQARLEAPWQARTPAAAEGPFIELPPAFAPTPWEPFQGYVEVGPNANVTLTRQGSGPLTMQVASPPSPPADIAALPAAVLEPLDDGEARSTHSVALQVTLDTQPLNGTLQGMGAIGGEPHRPTHPASPPLLRSGEVTVVGRRLGSELLYTVMHVPLRLGDEMRVMQQRRPPGEVDDAHGPGEAAEFACIFSVAPPASGGSGIDLACHASGRSLQISRFGERSGSLQPRPWDVLINEPSLQAVMPLAFTALFALIQRLLDGAYPRLRGWAHRRFRGWQPAGPEASRAPFRRRSRFRAFRRLPLRRRP